MKTFLKHVPNALTVLRIAAVPVFVLLMLEDRIYEAVVVFLIAEATDVLDGYIARRYQLITNFGKLADPFADKLMQLSALFLLAYKQKIMMAIPWLVLTKDLFLLISGVYLMRKKVYVQAKWFGKLATVLLFIGILLALFGIPRHITDAVMWLSVGMALFAALMYIFKYKSLAVKAKGKGTDTLDET